MSNKVEKEQPRKKCPKASEASFWTFFRGFSFSTLLATPSSFFQIRSSLSYLILLSPLYSSYDVVVWYSYVMNGYCYVILLYCYVICSHDIIIWYYILPWINVMLLWDDHFCIIFGSYLYDCGITVRSFLDNFEILLRSFWDHFGDRFGIVLGSF